MASSPSSGGLFSRLKRGRSRLDIKDGEYTASRISDAEKSFDITPTKRGASQATPSLSLPLSFSNASQSNLREDDGISKYLSTPSPSKDKDDPLKRRDLSKVQLDDVPEPTQKPGSSYSNAVSAAVNGMERTSSRSKESSQIGTLQSRIIIEMKEKEQLMGRFEALSRVHMALQEEIEKERSRAGKAEAASKERVTSKSNHEPSAPAADTAGALAGAGVGAVAGTAAMKEAEEKVEREKAEVEKLKSDLVKAKAQVDDDKAHVERQKAQLDQGKADVERDRRAIEHEKANMAKQTEAHSSLLAERENEKNFQASQQSELENARAKDKEFHTSQLTELQSHRAKDKEFHASQLSDLEARLSATNASLASATAEATRLMEHNEQLKNSAKSSQGPIQTTDAEFVEETNRLYSDVQKWVVNNFRNARVDFERLEKAGDSKELKQIRKAVTRYREAAGKAKLPFLQALVSARLMDEIWDDEFYAGMPGLVEEHETKEENVRGGLGYLREAYKVLSASNTPEFHAWRATTVSLLRRTPDPYLTAATNKFISRVAFSINNLLSSITSASSETTSAAIGSSPLPSRVRDLQAFISKTIDLARWYRSQRAVFEFVLPGSAESTDGLIRTASFEREAMEDVIADDAAEKTVVAAVWPLVRRLDEEERGRIVVVRAKVVGEEK